MRLLHASRTAHGPRGRLASGTRRGIDINKLRRNLVFERLLCRLPATQLGTAHDGRQKKGRR